MPVSKFPSAHSTPFPNRFCLKPSPLCWVPYANLDSEWHQSTKSCLAHSETSSVFNVSLLDILRLCVPAITSLGVDCALALAFFTASYRRLGTRRLRDEMPPLRRALTCISLTNLATLQVVLERHDYEIDSSPVVNLSLLSLAILRVCALSSANRENSPMRLTSEIVPQNHLWERDLRKELRHFCYAGVDKREQSQSLFLPIQV